MSRRWLWAAAALLAVTLAALVPLACERVEEEVEVGYRGPARLNPYLAAERLFDRLGVPARTSARTFELPPPDHALLLLRPEPLSQEEAQRLLEWTEQGGHLLYAIPPPEAGADPLLARLQVSLREPSQPQETEELLGEEVLDLGLPDSARARVALPRGARRFAEEGPWMRFVAAGSEDGAFLMIFDRDPGRITLVADASFLRNGEIGRHDHARLAWHLLGWQRAPEGALLVFRRGQPSLLALLARHAWPALLASVLLAAACLWRAAARFGPVAPDPPPDRRALLEHVEAAGELLWRHGHAGDLVEASRQALLRRVERRRPGWARLPRRELAARLAAAPRGRSSAGAPGTYLAPQRVAEALDGGVPSDPTDVLTTIQTLETLRRSL